MNHLLDRPLGQDERLRDRGVVLPLGHLAQHVALARRQLVQRRLLAAGVLGHERLDDLRVDHGAALCDGVDRGDELPEIVHTLLQEVGAPRAAALEQREKVARDRVLAEHDDADLGVRLAQSPGGLDPLVGVARRHADIGDDDVRPLSVDRCEQRVEVAADGRDLDLRMRLEQALGGPHGRGSGPRRERAGSAWAEDTPVTPLVLIVDDNEKNLKLASGRAARRRVPDARGRDCSRGDRARDRAGCRT